MTKNNKNEIFNRHFARLGRFLGRIVHLFDTRHRRIVRNNLQFAFPEWSRERVESVARSVFENMGLLIMEILQINSFSRQEVLHSLRIQGEKNIQRGLDQPKGAILISAHFGNWELGLLFMSCYVKKKFVSIARPIDTKILDRWLYRFRTRFGNNVIDKRKSLSRLRKALRQNHIIGTMIDQEPKNKDGVPVLFFNHEVTSTGVATLLARRYDVPVVMVFCYREKDGSFTLRANPPLQLQKTDDARADFSVNTQRMTKAIEDIVREYPEQWFWAHKRWKKNYPHLYPDLAARERRRARAKAKRIKEVARSNIR